MIKRKNKSCTTCSYYVIDEDISNLGREEQIEFEKFNTGSLSSITDDDLAKLAYLLQKLRRKTCIGGLVETDEIKKHCKHYKYLPTDFDKNQLLQSFIANSAKNQSKISLVISIILGLITAFVTLYGISQSSQNKELKNKIEENELSSQKLIEENANLNDSLTKLNITINNKTIKNE